MFDFDRFANCYWDITVDSKGQEQDAWDNLRALEKWAEVELDKIQPAYDFLSMLESYSARFYIEIAEVFDFAECWRDAG